MPKIVNPEHKIAVRLLKRIRRMLHEIYDTLGYDSNSASRYWVSAGLTHFDLSSLMFANTYFDTYFFLDFFLFAAFLSLIELFLRIEGFDQFSQKIFVHIHC